MPTNVRVIVVGGFGLLAFTTRVYTVTVRRNL